MDGVQLELRIWELHKNRDSSGQGKNRSGSRSLSLGLADTRLAGMGLTDRADVLAERAFDHGSRVPSPSAVGFPIVLLSPSVVLRSACR
jgi:hypothetical protein